MTRLRMPNTRKSITHKAQVAGCEFYLTVGLYPAGNPGELFIVMSKEGSTLAGFADAFGTAISLLLQSHWTVDELANKFKGSRFEPFGHTTDLEIPEAKSIVDYIFTWMLLRWGEEECSEQQE